MFDKRGIFLYVIAAILILSRPASAGDEKTWKDFFDTKKPGTLDDEKRIIVAGYHCGFTIQQGVSASVGGKKMAMNLMLGGIKKEDLQEIADNAYVAFLEQIKASGREVVSLEELKATKGYAKLDTTVLAPDKVFSVQYTVSQSRTYVVVSPKAIPLSFAVTEPLKDATSPVGNFKAIAAIADELKAVVVVPLVTIDFLNLESSGHSAGGAYSGTEYTGAKISAEPMMYIGPATTQYLFYSPGYGFGSAYVEKNIVIEGDFGNKFAEGDDAMNHFDIGSALISFDTGKNWADKMLLLADPPKYKQLVLQAHVQAGKYFGQILDKYKP